MYVIVLLIMNRFRALTVGLTMSAMAGNMAACSIEPVTPATTTLEIPSTSRPLTYDEIELRLIHQGELLDEGEEVRHLLQTDAPLNIIHLPNSAPTPQEDSYNSEIVARGVLKTIRGIVTLATGGRYTPKNVLVAQAKSIRIDNCIAGDDVDQAAKIQAVAQSLALKGALNAVFVDAVGCKMSGGRLDGYDAPGYIPVVTANAYASTTLGSITLHEEGHAAGLLHAGAKGCETPATISSCSFKRTRDPISLMGYLDGLVFTSPELDALGLLKSSEIVVDAKSGLFTLGAATDPESILKALTFNTPKGRVYISWEDDPQAGSDSKCISEAESEAHPEDNSEVQILYADQGYVCNQVNFRYLPNGNALSKSLQVREFQEAASKDGAEAKTFNLIYRPDRAPDKFQYDPSNGEVSPGKVVYQNDQTLVKYLGLNMDNRAIVQVSPLK